MYELFFPGKNREDSIQNDVIVITGGKGLGKTTLTKYIAKLYKKYNKYDRVILLTGITNVKFPSYPLGDGPKNEDFEKNDEFSKESRILNINSLCNK
jgi:thymidylate kinase